MPNKTLLLIGVGVGVGLVLVVVARFALPKVGEAINPLNQNNVFTQAAGGVVSALTGREETLGGWLAEWFDPNKRAVADMLRTPPYAPQVVAGNPVQAQGYGHAGAFLP